MTARMTSKASRGWRVTAPAGDYFIGDLASVLGLQAWLELLGETHGFTQPIGEHEGATVLAFCVSRDADDNDMGTDYRDRTGKLYRIENSFIGMVPLRFALQNNTLASLEKLGRVLSYVSAFDCTSGPGIVAFGQYVIDTGFDDEAQAGGA